MEKPPPPGVSTIGPNNERRPIDVEAPEKTVTTVAAKPKKVARGQTAPRGGRKDDVLAQPERGRKVSSPVPSGVQTRESDIIEMPLPSFRIPKTSTASWTSIDGNEYVFRTKDTRGRPLPFKNELCLFLALVELAKGGSPLTVFEAFKLKLKDMHDQEIFPLPEGVEDALRGGPKFEAVFSGQAYEEEPSEEELEDSGLSFGE